MGQGGDSFSSQVSSEPPACARARQARPSDTVVQKTHVRSLCFGQREGRARMSLQPCMATARLEMCLLWQVSTPSSLTQFPCVHTEG